MANAQFWVHYTDKARPEQSAKLLTLCSPDLVNGREAIRRAAKTAKARLAKRGIKAVIVSCQCVG